MPDERRSGVRWQIGDLPGSGCIVNEVQSPSEEDFQRSGRILEAYEQARAAGLGSLALSGKMIDERPYASRG